MLSHASALALRLSFKTTSHVKLQLDTESDRRAQPRRSNTLRSPSGLLSLVNNRIATVGGHFQFGRCHLHLVLRASTVESPLQLVALQLIRALEHLPEHGELCRAVPGELRRYLDACLSGLPLTDDQFLGVGTAA